MRRLASRLARRCGIVPSTNNKPGRHLPWDHPSLCHVRSWVALGVAQKKFHSQLIANFDQTWSLNFQPARRPLVKKDAPDELKSIHARKLRHRIERVLEMPFTEAFPGEGEEVEPREVHRPTIQGSEVAHTPVEGFRIPHTLCTLSWIDGRCGRGYVTIRDDALGEKQRASLNKVLVFATVLMLCFAIVFRLDQKMECVSEVSLSMCDCIYYVYIIYITVYIYCIYIIFSLFLPFYT